MTGAETGPNHGAAGKSLVRCTCEEPVRVALIEPLGQSGPLDIAYSLGCALRRRGIDATLVTTRTHHPPVAGSAELPLVGLLGGMDRARPRFLRALDYTASLFTLWRFLRGGAFDLLHFQDSLLPQLDAPLLAALKASGARVVFTAQDPDQDAINSPGGRDQKRSGGLRLRRLSLGRIYSVVDHVVALSECGRRDLLESFGVPARKVSAIPHGNCESYIENGGPGAAHAKAQLGIPVGNPVVLFFGSIKPTKGVDHLLRAFRRVHEACPSSLLLVAGEPRRGVDGGSLVDLARCQGLDGAVRLHLGYVANDRVPLYFSAADVVALPYTNVYQSGVVQMAYAFRRPVVASRVGGLAEVVEDGRTGLLVPPGDEDALAEALVTLLSSAEARRRMGECGHRLAAKKYSWGAIAERMATVYESVVTSTAAEEGRGK